MALREPAAESGVAFAAKNLKYITVTGHAKTAVADPEELEGAVEDIRRLMAASPALLGEFGIAECAVTVKGQELPAYDPQAGLAEWPLPMRHPPGEGVTSGPTPSPTGSCANPWRRTG